MKFFTASEIFSSVIFAVLTGTIFGCIYKCFESLICALKKIIFIFFDSFFLSADFSIQKFNEAKIKRKNLKMSLFLKNIFEGIMFTLFGIATLLLLYICLDGVFRVYIIVIAVIFFIISVKTIAQGFSRLFDWVFNKAYSMVLFLLSIILVPFSKVITVLSRLAKRIILPIKLKMQAARSQYIVKKKIKEINSNFKF